MNFHDRMMIWEFVRLFTWGCTCAVILEWVSWFRRYWIVGVPVAALRFTRDREGSPPE